MNVFKKGIQRLVNKATISVSPKMPRSELRQLMRREEAKIGGSLFGPVPTGKQREFFRETHNTWIWNEGSTNPNKPMISTRYEIHSDRVVKIQDNHQHKVIYGEELEHFYQAVNAYAREVRALYSSLS